MQFLKDWTRLPQTIERAKEEVRERAGKSESGKRKCYLPNFQYNTADGGGLKDFVYYLFIP